MYTIWLYSTVSYAFISPFVFSTVASGLNALAAVTVEDFAPLVVRHIPTEREALVSKLLGNSSRNTSPIIMLISNAERHGNC